MTKTMGVVVAALAMMVATGCKPPAKEQAQAPGAATGGSVAANGAADAEAKQIFSLRCTPCHGPNGAGDGPASAGLTPKPRNFTDPAWQKSVTDAHIEQIIKFGGAAVGKAPMMPGNPDLADKDAVVAALRAHVRSLAK